MISVRSLWKVYGPRAERLVGSADADLPRAELEARTGNVVAMRDINLDVAPGEVFVVMGLSGSGKSTLIRSITRLIEPTSGTVRLGGINVVEQPNDVRRRLAWMPDHFTPYKDTTVLQYLDFFARAQDLHGAERTRRLAEIADFTNLHPLRERPVDKLSKGQLQRGQGQDDPAGHKTDLPSQRQAQALSTALA